MASSAFRSMMSNIASKSVTKKSGSLKLSIANSTKTTDDQKFLIGESTRDKDLTQCTSVAQTIFNSYYDICFTICRPDADVINSNKTTAISNLLDFERYISLESVVFISRNFAILFAALILNFKNIRQVMMNAITNEINIDDMPSDKKEAFRMQQNGNVTLNGSHFIELGISIFTDEILHDLYNNVIENFGKVTATHKLTDDTESAVEHMSMADKCDLSTIVSNYVYLLRAFNNNVVFFKQVSDIIKDLAVKYNIPD